MTKSVYTCCLAGCILLLTTLGAGAAEAVAKKMHTIVFSHFEMKEATVETVFKYIKTRAQELDPEQEGINFVFRYDEDSKKSGRKTLITAELKNIPVGDLIRIICRLADMKYKVDKHAVVIADKSVPLEQMETRVYRLDPAVLGGR